MPRKNTLLKYQTITSGNMASASVTSAITNIQFLDNIGIQTQWAGTTPIGTLAIQVSADYAQDANGNVTNSGTWTPLVIQGSASMPVTGNTGSIYVDITQISAPWIRSVYTKTSGTGTINAFITGKEV